MKKKKQSLCKAYIRIIQYALKKTPQYYFGILFLSMGSVGGAYINLASAEYMVNSAYSLYQGNIAFPEVLRVMLLFFLGDLFFILCGAVCKILTQRMSYLLEKDFSYELQQHLSTIDYEYYEIHGANLKIYNVKTRSFKVIWAMLNSTFFYFGMILQLVVYGVYLFRFNYLIVLIYIVMVLAFNTFSNKIYDRMWKLWDEAQEYTQKKTYFWGLATGKVFHQEMNFNRLFNYVASKWEKQFDDELRVTLKIHKNFELNLQTARIIFNIPYIFMLCVTAYEIALGRYGIGFFVLANRLFNNIIGSYISFQSKVNQDREKLKFYFEYEEVKNYRKHGDRAKYNDISPYRIEVSNLSYQYPQTDFLALNGISFECKAGDRIAVVGENGSGKTTLAGVLSGLLSNYSGKIQNQAHMDFSPRDISCIFQDFMQYNMSIRENIVLGAVDKVFDDSELWKILRDVGMEDFVKTLPGGLDTMLGQFENGIELSKGQWQRLAIARLLANPSAGIWILDEPTAYLDPISEIEMYHLIERNAGNRIVFFISHRLGFARECSFIITMQNGRIIEKGNHKQLMDHNGVYAKMYLQQRKWYESEENIND